MEHYEEGSLSAGKLQWTVGTNWPEDPKEWFSAKAPTRSGKSKESTDSWDVTSLVDTPEKLRTLQFHVQNNDTGSLRKTMIDHVYMLVEWDWVASAEKLVEPDTGLVRYGFSEE